MRSRFFLACGGLLMLEVIALLAFGDRALTGDERQYVAYATHLIEDGSFSLGEGPSLYRTPGYPAFLAALRLVDGSLALVTAAQVALLGLLAWIVYQTTLRLAGVREAQVTAVACLTYLPFVWLTNMELTEILATVLIAPVTLMLVLEERRWHYAAAGALLGCAGLVRPALLALVVPVALGILIWRCRWGAGIVIACTLLTLVPWVVRNQALVGEPVLAGGTSATLYGSAMQWQGKVGYTFDGPELRRYVGALQPAILRANAQGGTTAEKEIRVEDELGAEARDQFSKVTATDVLRELPQRIAYLWAVADYPQVSGYRFWHGIAQIQHFALLLLAAVGAWFAVRDLRRFWPVLSVPVALTLTHLIVLAEPRYSIPGRPALIVLAATGLAQLARARRQPTSRSGSP